jgi:hypothetical protein
MVKTPRRRVGNGRVDDALASDPIRSQRISRPVSVANARRGRSGRVEGRPLGTPVLQ